MFPGCVCIYACAYGYMHIYVSITRAIKVRHGAMLEGISFQVVYVFVYVSVSVCLDICKCMHL